MPWYRKHGKIQTIMTSEEFKKGLMNGRFVKRIHRAFCILLYYTGIRKGEALRVVKEQFRIEDGVLLFEVGKRLKSHVQTAPLNIPLDAPFVDELVGIITQTNPKERVFQFSPKTAYNIVSRVFHYPHHFRLNRITNFFLDGFTIPEVRSWTGHKTLKGLEPYIGLVDVKKMGASLGKKAEVKS